jgi:excisionase family DNA binding protein
MRSCSSLKDCQDTFSSPSEIRLHSVITQRDARACMKRDMTTIETPETANAAGHSNPKDYESKQELAARLGVSVRTIDNLLKCGLPYLRLTRKLIRFPRVAVNEWLAERQVRRA